MWSLRLLFLVLQISLALLAETPPPRYTHISRKFVSANTTLRQISTRIHGGMVAEEKQFPYMVFIFASAKNGFQYKVLTCSASLINVKWVLTAAHCVMPRENPPSIIAVAGKSNLRIYYNARKNIPFSEDIDEAFFKVQERRVVEVHIHPSYKDPQDGHDLALLLMNKPFVITDAVQTMPLSNRKMVSMTCTVLGWGLNENDEQTFELAYAQPVKAQTPEIYCFYIKRGPLICLEMGGGGICRGDSGSPLVCNGEIWGVASFSASNNSIPGCTREQEEYFSQIYPDIQWIKDVKGKASLPDFKSAALLVSFVFWLFVQ